jgi:hypothetical protein
MFSSYPEQCGFNRWRSSGRGSGTGDPSTQQRDDGVTVGWEKFAISGATYARALGNAAQRSGARMGAPLLNRISAQPQARLTPGLSAAARTPGALTPTPRQQSLQNTLRSVPESWGSDVAPAPHQATLQRFMFNDAFRGQSQMVQSPSIQPLNRWMSQRSQGAGTNAATPVALRASAPKLANILPSLAQIGVPLAAAGGILASKPGIHADLANLFSGGGDIQQKDQAQAIPESAMGQAHRAAEILRQRGMDPMKLRFAVDAPVGAGKTTLSRALAQEMGLHHKSLDYRPNLRINQMLGGGDVEKMPMRPEPGDVLEHHQLLRAYDPEAYDVAIHLLRNPDTLRQQLIQRGRGARAADIMDLDKSIDVGRRAFESLGGDAVDLGEGTMMKIRPQEGWGHGLDDQLSQAHIDPTGLSRHEKLLSLNAGHAMHGSGWLPYMRSPLSQEDTDKIKSTIPLGAAAASALS